MWTREKWINDWCKKYPSCSEDILGFIYDFCNCHNEEPEASEIIERFFRAGYCYYFALMLKDAFGGEVIWLKYRSHIVWRDTRTNTLYDVCGVCTDYTEEEIIPFDIVKYGLESFRHRGLDTKLNTDEIEAYVQPRVNEYERKMGWTITKNPYYHNNDNNVNETMTKFFD